jgi:hypothetical protein
MLRSPHRATRLLGVRTAAEVSSNQRCRVVLAESDIFPLIYSMSYLSKASGDTTLANDGTVEQQKSS